MKVELENVKPMEIEKRSFEIGEDRIASHDNILRYKK